MRALLLVLLCFAAVSADPVDEFFEKVWFEYQPSAGVAAGFHEYDARLEDPRRLADEVAALRASLEAVRGVQDEDFLVSTIRGRLQDLTELKGWETNPDRYQSVCTYGAFVLISRTFAPPAARMQSLTARERQMPAVLASARTILKNPPRIYTEIALEQLPGSISFFEKDVPLAFEGVRTPEFDQANAAVVAALKEYQTYLKSLLPRSTGDFRIGAEAFRNKLLYDEMISTPLASLDEIGVADLRRNQEAFARTANALWPDLSRPEALALLEKHHPAPEELLPSLRALLGGLKRYCEEHDIVTIPSEVLPLVEESPPFMRALTFASMDNPGPYEKKATEAYFHVTLPEKDWSAKEVEEHMAGFNQGTLVSTAVHEAYPGHYVQFLWSPGLKGKVRRILWCATNAEGWAHYTEEMMLDEGYGGKDALELRLGQLQDALLRNARFLVGLRMHTGKMTFDEGVAFFEKEGYCSHANAVRETKRGTADPTYLYYTLGKLEVKRLREDCRKAWGAGFTLRRFHDELLAQGSVPFPLVRRALLGSP